MFVTINHTFSTFANNAVIKMFRTFQNKDNNNMRTNSYKPLPKGSGVCGLHRAPRKALVAFTAFIPATVESINIQWQFQRSFSRYQQSAARFHKESQHSDTSARLHRELEQSAHSAARFDGESVGANGDFPGSGVGEILESESFLDKISTKTNTSTNTKTKTSTQTGTQTRIGTEQKPTALESKSKDSSWSLQQCRYKVHGWCTLSWNKDGMIRDKIFGTKSLRQDQCKLFRENCLPNESTGEMVLNADDIAAFKEDESGADDTTGTGPVVPADFGKASPKLCQQDAQQNTTWETAFSAAEKACQKDSCDDC